jgi:hypothetical protein
MPDGCCCRRSNESIASGRKNCAAEPDATPPAVDESKSADVQEDRREVLEAVIVRELRNAAMFP